MKDRVKHGMVLQIHGDVEEVFRTADENKDGFIEKDEMKKILKSLNCYVTNEELTTIMQEMTTNQSDHVSSCYFLIFKNIFKKFFFETFFLEKNVESLFRRFQELVHCFGIWHQGRYSETIQG